MRKLLLALAFLSFASPGLAQNTQCSDRPVGDSSNACANTRFVQGIAAGGSSRTVTANDPIVSTDCGKAVGLGGNVQFIETLPSVSGFPTNCEVTVLNTDAYPGGRGKILSGFPADLDSILYPKQSASVKIISGVWTTTYNPGRWKNPTTVTWHVDKTNGSNANDGLAATTGAVLDAQTANTHAVYRSDTQGTTPIIAMACSQTHTTALNMGGTPLGTNLIQLSPDGNCGFTWTNAGPCISIADIAELDLNLNFYGSSGTASFGCNTSNAASTGNILEHNVVVLDLEGTPTWTPGGANDNFLFCDGDCGFTVANGVTQAGAGTGNYIIYMSAGGKGTQSGTISASGAGNATGIYYLYNAMLIIGTPSGGGWGSLGPSKINGQATFVSNGVTPAGGVTVSATGANCTSLTSATCTTNGPAVAWGASPACGTATITTTSARQQPIAASKIMFVQVDFTITAIGTCTTAFNFTLPVTAQSGGAIIGEEILAGKGVVCRVTAASGTAGCVKTDVAVWLVNDHFVASGTYESQ